MEFTIKSNLEVKNMFCPKCGNEIDLFADKCLSCGMNFKSMSIAQRKKFNRKPMLPKKRNIQRKVKTRVKGTAKSPTSSPTSRVEYNNGYATVEGMSIRGTRFNKGSFKRRNNNEGCGFSFPVNSLDHY